MKKTKTIIQTGDNSQVVTGDVEGGISNTNTRVVNASKEHSSTKEPPKASNKFVIVAATITAIGSIISGFLIAYSNFFKG